MDGGFLGCPPSWVRELASALSSDALRAWSIPVLHLVTSNLGSSLQAHPTLLRCIVGQGGFSGGSVVKNPPASEGDTGSVPGLRRFLGEGNGKPLQYSCLGTPLDRGAWWDRVAKRVRPDLVIKQHRETETEADRGRGPCVGAPPGSQEAPLSGICPELRCPEGLVHSCSSPSHQQPW